MRLLVVQHVAFEAEANIGEWCALHGHTISRLRLYAGEPFPELAEFDALAIMGGPMNIYEHEKYPWLVAEKDFLRRSLEAGKLALGICLGAQLLSDALGGKVTRNREREIGWHQVTLTAEGRASAAFKQTPASFVPFHWHGDTFSIPPQATRLAGSAACGNQAFLANDGKALALQFHLEYSAKSILDMLEHCADDLKPSGFVQSVAEITGQTHLASRAKGILFNLLDGWAATSAL